MNNPFRQGTVLGCIFLIIQLVSPGVGLTQPQPVGQWNFDDPGNLLHAIAGVPLDLVGEHIAVSGIDATDGAIRVGAGNYYKAWYDIAPNGGKYVNQYSFVFDFKIPQIDTWYCFYNTRNGATNDGDGWITPDGHIGENATGYSDFAISAGEWYRLAIVVDLVAGHIEYFINGKSIHLGTIQDLDGRFSLLGNDREDPYLILFAYNTNEHLLMDVSMVSLYDKPLTPAEVSSLGGPQPASQLSNLGDVTGDFVVDGRDALKILRDSKGLETIPAGSRQAGDVHPFPGVNGHAIGDEVLTSSDAQKILDYSVGLISSDELTGNLNQLTPRIDDVLPGRAGVGGLVVLEGENFMVGEAENPNVFFHEFPGVVLNASDKEISVRVPEGATNGPIKVETFLGTTQTIENFIILPKTEGVLDLGDGLNPEDFIVVDGMDETVASPDGSFQLTMIPEYASIVGAVPKGDGDNSFLAVFIPRVSDQEDQPFKIDADSTARALVYMHPFFMSKEIPVAKWMMARMEDVPELDNLAAIIREKYPQGANGLEDADVKEAWSNAVIALVDAIPETVSYEVEANALAGKTAFFTHLPFNPLSNSFMTANRENTGINDSFNPQPLQVATQDGDTPEIFHIDREYLAAKYDSNKQGLDLHISNNNFCPVDWVVRLYRVDPKEFSRGWNTPYEEIATTPYTHLHYKLTTVVAAKQWTALIDLVREGFNYVFDGFKSETVLNLQADPSHSSYLADDSVYLLRCANGAFRDHDPRQWDFQVLKSQNAELYNQHLKARAVNIALILCDAWSLFSDENSSVYRKSIVAAIKNNTASLASKVVELDNQDIESQSTLNRFLDILLDTSKGFAQTFLEHGMSNAGDKVQNQLKSVFSSCSALTSFLSKASTLGRIAERGYGLGGLAFGARSKEVAYGVTPLETFQVVVGDPFNPVIDSFSPQFGAVGDEIVISGKHFYRQGTKVYLSKYFEYENYESEAIPVEVVEAAENQLKVKVPEGLFPFETYNFIVRTP